MSKVTKEFWVNNSELEDIDKSIDCCIQLAKNRNMVYRNKITVTYEIDREVTIKESVFDRLFTSKEGFFERDLQIIKNKLFGGGENE